MKHPAKPRSQVTRNVNDFFFSEIIYLSSAEFAKRVVRLWIIFNIQPPAFTHSQTTLFFAVVSFLPEQRLDTPFKQFQILLTSKETVICSLLLR